MKRIIIVGAGGFAREVRWLIEEINAVHREWAFGGYVVSDLTKLGEHDDRDAVLPGVADDVEAFVVGDAAFANQIKKVIHRNGCRHAFPLILHASS